MVNHKLNDTHIASFSIYLDSSHASVSQGTTGSNCLWFLDNVIQCPPDTQMLIGLTACQIPLAWYNITSHTNKITINGSVNGSTLVILPPKNYNTDTLCTAVNAQLITAGNNVTMSFDESLGKFVFTSLTQLVSIIYTTMHREIGLPETSVPTILSATLEMPALANLSATDAVYVTLNNISLISLDSRANGDNNGVVAKVNTLCNFGSYLEYNPSEVIFYSLDDRHISHFNISLSDDQQQLLDMNGVPWAITLTVHFTKKRTPVNMDDFFLDRDSEFIAYNNDDAVVDTKDKAKKNKKNSRV